MDILQINNNKLEFNVHHKSTSRNDLIDYDVITAK